MNISQAGSYFPTLTMPSRKKAQGQARKAKRAAETQSTRGNLTDAAAACCKHLGQPTTNWSQDDWDAAVNFYDEYIDKYNYALETTGSSFGSVMVAQHTYSKYRQLNDARKNAFRRIVIAGGTEDCVRAANEKDLTKETNMRGIFPHVTMVQIIEVRDKYNGPTVTTLSMKL